jgi:DNA-binding LacI/PurR family transcriptional regulator
MDALARLTGVSKTTIHRALSGNGRISSETRERILAAAKQTGYRPNRLARSLRSARSGLIGVVLPGIQGPFYARMLEGLERALDNVDHRVLVTVSDGISKRERDLVEGLLDTRVDGLVIASEMVDPDYYRSLMRRGTALVFVDREVPGLSADLVATDHFAGGVMLGEHLKAMGRTSPAFYSFSNVPIRMGSIEDRWCGFRSVFRNAARHDHPLVASAEKYLDAHPETSKPDTFSRLCRFAVAGAMEPIADFPYDSVFAQYDHFALAIMQALKQSGRRIPEDVAIVGFDNQDFTEYSDPPLTTIQQPLFEIGQRAAELLLNRMNDFNLPPQACRLAPRLIARRSCGAFFATEQP